MSAVIFTCPDDGLVFPTEADLRQHREVVHGDPVMAHLLDRLASLESKVSVLTVKVGP